MTAVRSVDSATDVLRVSERVERSLAGLEPLAGRVLFLEDGWVYWEGDDGHVHASRQDVLRRVR